MIARLETKGWTRSKFAAEAKCPRSLVTELLNGKLNATTYLPEMHSALGWDPPQPPLPSKDAGEMTYLWERLDEAGRERLIAAARGELDRLLKRAASPETDKKKR